MLCSRNLSWCSAFGRQLQYCNAYTTLVNYWSDCDPIYTVMCHTCFYKLNKVDIVLIVTFEFDLDL